MVRMHTYGKRCLAMLMAVLLLFSSFNAGILQLPNANATETEPITDGELLAANYGLSDGEKALLLSGLLREHTYNYEVKPTADYDLVTVDPEEKTITAKTFTHKEFVWYPKEALVISGDDSEKVSLQEDAGKYVGNFNMEGNTYSVQVTYELHINVAQAEQEKLLQAGADLKQGLDTLDKLSQLEGLLDTQLDDMDVTARVLLQQVVEGLMGWVEGIPSAIPGMTFYYPGSWAADEEKSAPVKALYNQMQNNGGDLDLFVMLAQYSVASSKVQYLMENGEALLAKAEETAAYLEQLLAEQTVVLQMLDVATGMGIQMAFEKTDLEDFYKSIGYVLNGVDSSAVKFAGLKAVTSEPMAILNNNPFVADLDAFKYAKLDVLAKDLTATATEVTITEKLLADTATVQVNMNRQNVTVKVVANVVERNSLNSDELKVLVSDKSALITLNKGVSYEVVWAAIEESGVIADALAGWEDAYQVGDSFYTSVVEGMNANDVLDKDVEITIIYTPKSYTLSGVDGLPASVPYGYNLVLPKHSDDKLVYDYEMNGVFYRQNSIYRVVSDTHMVRTAGEAWHDLAWGEAVSHAVSQKAAAVLVSKALDTGILAIRNPVMNGGITIQTDLNGTTTVRAITQDSGIDGLPWVPARAYYLQDGQRFPITNFVNGEGSFDEEDYDSVEVEYTLALKGIIADAQMLEILNLPGVLAGEAKEQKDILNKLSGMKGSLQQLASNINALKLLLEGNTLTEEGKAALRMLIDECYNNQTKQMYLYEYLLSYEKDGLTWYYAGSNYEVFVNEFEKLRNGMNKFLDATPNLKSLLEDLNYGDKYDMVAGVREDLNAITMLAPNAAIIRDSSFEQLTALVEAIEAASMNEVYTSVPEIERTEVRSKQADNRRSVTIHVLVDGKIKNTYTMVFMLGQKLEASHIQKMSDALQDMNNALTIDKRFYNYTGVALPEMGFVMTEDLVLDFAYNTKVLDVIVDGVGSIGSFTVDSGKINLPACGDEGFRYRYIIDGEIIDTYNASVEYTLTMSQKLFLLNGGTIRRETINLARQDILDFVASLNDGLVKEDAIGGAAFIPMEDANGNYTIVLKLSPLSSGFKAQQFALSVAQSIINSSYGYIDMGGYVMRNESSFHLQGILDALLDSGFTLNDLEKAINSDGSINNMTLAGHTLITDGLDLSRIPNTDKLGGKLLETEMGLATSATGKPTNVKLYITLSDDGTGAKTYSTLDKGLTKVTPYVNVHLADGSANLVLNLPDKAYQAFLAAMLVTGNTELGEVNTLDYEGCINYLYGLIKPLLDDDTISAETFENTAGVFGKDVDLQGAQKVLDLIYRVLNHIHTNVEYSNLVAVGNLYHQDIAYPVDNLLNKLPIPETLLEVIAEKSGKIEATLGIQLKNVENTKYEALVIDLKADGLNKAVFVTDLQATLNKIHDNAVVILVDDIAGNISTDKNIFLNLNGKTVNGNVSGANITLLDSTIGNLGNINGSFNGEDIRSNNLYTTVADGDTINVYLNCGILALDEAPALKNIASDLALDLILNYYTAAALSLDGDVIYSIDLEDLVGMVDRGASSSINEVIDLLKCEGLTNFTNKLLADLTDFAALAEAGKNGEKLLSYTVGTKAWSVSVSHNQEKDYLTGGITPNAAEKTKTLNILLGGTKEEQAVLINLFEELGKVVDSKLHVNLEDISYADRVVSVEGSASADILINTKDNHDYAVALLTLLAADRKDNAAIIKAIETYYAENKVAPMKDVVDNTTIAQLLGAFKNVNRSTNFAAMVAKFGMDDVITVDVIELMNDYRPVILVAAKALNTLEITGPSTKLSAFATEGENGAYDLSKALKRAGTIKVFGYDLAVEGSLKVVLFALEPELIDGDMNISENENVYGSKVDEENKQIYLDVIPNGITADQFAQLITHGAINADKIEVKFDETDLLNNKVVNGATVEIIASNNNSSVVDTVTYTVIILGDVNCDGMNDVGDTVALMRHCMKEHDLAEKFGEHALLAADMNYAQGLDVADAVLIMRKCMGDNYISLLN